MTVLPLELLSGVNEENAEAYFYAHYDQAIRLLCPDYEEMMTALVMAVPGTARAVLDLGCGTGSLIAMLAQAHPAIGVILGLDRDPRLLAEARTKLGLYPHVVLLQGDIRSFPLPEAEVVVSSLVLHNLAPREQADLYERVARVTPCFLQFEAVAGDGPADEAERWAYLRWWLTEQGLPEPVRDLTVRHIQAHDRPLSLEDHARLAERVGLRFDPITVAPGFAVFRASRDR
jgi:SAM-dependent methyltransferase